MHGPRILTRSLSKAAVKSKGSTNVWQYHSRSDRHSKIACWCILLDLMLEADLLRRHFKDGILAFGVNHEMSDFRMNRKKNLDLVVSTPRTQELSAGRTFSDLVAKYDIVLTEDEHELLVGLPPLSEAPVGMVRIALEAKACMTEHIKALPRLHDELNSSHRAIHGSANHAIAVGFAMINAADSFISSDRNKFDLDKYPAQITSHKQPHAIQRTLEKLEEIPRRSKETEEGFDAFGALVVDAKNDGSPVTVSSQPPAPQPDDIFEYEAMIRRTADLYASRYR